jgi:hypothetical protein
MAKDKDKPEVQNGEKIMTPLEYLRSKLDHEYVRHQPQHKKPKDSK